MNECKGLLLKYCYRQARPIIREGNPDYRFFYFSGGCRDESK